VRTALCNPLAELSSPRPPLPVGTQAVGNAFREGPDGVWQTLSNAGNVQKPAQAFNLPGVFATAC